MISRREFLGITAGSSAAFALTPNLPSAFQTGKLIQRAIPSTGEMLPVVSFGAEEKSDSAAMKEILKTLIDSGGRVVDASHGGGDEVARTAASELGIQGKLFWITGGVIGKVDAAAVRAGLEKQLATFKVPTIDAVMVSTSFNVPTHLAVLKEMKKEGRVRYLGVRHLAFPTGAPFGDLESFMRNEPIDFVATDYHAGDRRAEEKILPLAQERKIAFMAYFAFDRGRLFKRVGTTPLPEWAAEFDARTWPQFFLKFVLSNPAVIVARTGTTKAAHMLDNIGGGIGRLPDAATRKRMAQLVDKLPKYVVRPA